MLLNIRDNETNSLINMSQGSMSYADTPSSSMIFSGGRDNLLRAIINVFEIINGRDNFQLQT
jgi:hypothetical protein